MHKIYSYTTIVHGSEARWLPNLVPWLSRRLLLSLQLIVLPSSLLDLSCLFPSVL